MDEVIQKILGLLQQMQDERGVPAQSSIVDKNILKNDNSTFDNGPKISPILSGNEKKRLNEVFTIFNNLFFAQQKKMLGDNKPETLIAKLNQQQKASQTQNKPEASKFNWLTLLVGGVALVAASIPLILGAIFDKFGSFSDAASILGKVGLWGGLKMLSSTILKFFAVPLLKKLPIIGSLIYFYEAYQDFKADKPVKGLLSIASGILMLVPGLGPVLAIGVDILSAILEAKGMFDPEGALSSKNAWTTIKGWAVDIGNWIWDNGLYLPIIGTFKRFGMASDEFKSGNYGEGLKQILLGMLTFTGGGAGIKGFEILAGFLNGNLSQPPKEITEDSSWSDRLIEWIRSKLKVLPWWIKKPLAWFGIIPDEMVGDVPSNFTDVVDGAKAGFEKTKNFIGGIWDNLKDPMKNSVDTIKGFAVDVWENTKDFSAKAWETVTNEAPKIWNSIKETSQNAFDKAKQVGSWFMDSIQVLADKTKEKISEWAPSVIEFITGVADNAMSVLKGIADKIGGWIAGLFSADEEKKLHEQVVQNSQNTDKKEYFSKEQAKQTEAVIQNTNYQTEWLKLLTKTSQQQVDLLNELVVIGANSLKELKRVSGNTNSGGSNVNVITSPQSQSTPLVPIGSNRTGFSQSPYSL